MTVFFTSDTHFGHKNVIGFCERPWSSVGSMNAALAALWNETVCPTDTVYHLGDFGWHTMSPTKLHYLFRKLNGRKHLIVGNHDDRNVLRLPWESVQGELTLDINGHVFVLSHYPPTRTGLVHEHIYLHGHLHSRRPPSMPVVDVGVDANAYVPIPAEALVHAADVYADQMDKLRMLIEARA